MDTLDRHVLRLLGPTTKAAAVRPADLRLLIDKLNAEGLSSWYVHSILTAVSLIFRFAVRRDLVAENPARALERETGPARSAARRPATSTATRSTGCWRS